MKPLKKPEANKMDRRKQPRFVKRLETKIIYDHISFCSISSDLSESGLFIRTNRGLSIDTPLEIKLSLPGNKASLLKGIVRRTIRTGISSMKNGMGIEIIDRDETFIDFIKSITGVREENSSDKDITQKSRTASYSPHEFEKKAAGQTFQERRQHKRFKVGHMKVNSEMPSATDVQVIDISKNGVLVKADKKLDMGKQYALKIGYENKVLFVKATVVWSLLADNIANTDGSIIPIYIAGMQLTDVLRGEITEIISRIEADINATSCISVF